MPKEVICTHTSGKHAIRKKLHASIITKEIVIPPMSYNCISKGIKWFSFSKDTGGSVSLMWSRNA
jgi:hypothetical protein